MSNTKEQYPSNFIRSIIEKDVADGKNSGQVMTRFPPEPNGYLHIGHAKNSPFRARTVDENLDLFRRMRAGEFADGEHILRLKIDMSSPNINMRDPAIYRIRHIEHHQTGKEWCIYPMYDYTHCVSDSLEGITHSLCDLGFEDHRPLYDWVLNELVMNCHPQQIEFSRLNLQFTVMSKRKIRQLVEENIVDSWDDPRLPTLSGLRRRGYTASAIRDFCRRIGVTKSDNNVELALLQSCIRDELDASAPRVMGVLNPVKVVIENFPESESVSLELPNHPKDEAMGTRLMNFTREIYIDREDFREEANRKYKRLVLGDEVRLRYGFVIKAEQVIKDDMGETLEIRASYDPDTLGKNPEGRKVRGVIHWVSATEGLPAEIRVYEPLFVVDFPDADERDYHELINDESLKVHQGFVEPGLKQASLDERFQFEREGYFCVDSKHSTREALIFNRVVGLRDTWAKIVQSGNS